MKVMKPDHCADCVRMVADKFALRLNLKNEKSDIEYPNFSFEVIFHLHFSCHRQIHYFVVNGIFQLQLM